MARCRTTPGLPSDVRLTFKSLLQVFEGLDILPQENDGQNLFDALVNGRDIKEILAGIEGPYAFVFYERSSGKLYFARDPLGRRSLLIHHPNGDEPYLILVSANSNSAPKLAFEEVATDGIYCLDTTHTTISDDGLLYTPITLIPRDLNVAHLRSEWLSVTTLNPKLPPTNLEISDWESPSVQLQSSIDVFIAALDESVRLRVQHIPLMNVSAAGQPRVGILFSGGIDCSVLAYLTHRHLPITEPIDLLNVAFENPRVLNASTSSSTSKASKKSRRAKAGALNNEEDTFSNTKGMYDVPDRLTGLEQLQELRRVCQNRTWNFVEVNVPYEQCQMERTRVEGLMYPSRTVMDLSLALALYFASRGIGMIRPSPTSQPTPYASPARVLLSGLGSDELLGGYARHRHAYTRDGWHGLVSELQLDLTRLPTRNLGRDDRVISENGKETRYPYLSLTLVDLVAKLPVHVKADPRLPEGTGDKILLRMAAAKLGLVTASRRRKRAMQFGSRSARMEIGEKDGKKDLVE
ncbi:hypothetical protein FRB94_008194 [Tulasnella sp. JGI-2019a]|nr:hypothetical protein FRB94_008194 [Tulasnella sp. JGI-2019a]KAG9028659.1 hypothetical protein FRB95_006251 [Tulasnella sp. JGI-2019a]